MGDADEPFVIEELPSDDEEPDFDPSASEDADEPSDSSEPPNHQQSPRRQGNDQDLNPYAPADGLEDSPGTAALAHALSISLEEDFGLPLNFEEEILPSSSEDEDDDDDEAHSTATEPDSDEDMGPLDSRPASPLFPFLSSPLHDHQQPSHDHQQPSPGDQGVGVGVGVPRVPGVPGDQGVGVGVGLGSGGISRRTRANVSLREMTLEELEKELHDEFADIADEEAYEDQVSNSPSE